MASQMIRGRQCKIMSLSDGASSSNLCNFFPTHSQEHWHHILAPHAEQHVPFNWDPS